jgi:hypothetical protein
MGLQMMACLDPSLRRSVPALGITLALAFALEACDGACHLAPCPNVSVRLELSIPLHETTSLTVTACTNDRCSSGTLECQSDEERRSCTGWLTGDLPGVYAVAGEPYAAEDAGIPNVTMVHVEFHSNRRRRGDQYSVRVAKAGTDETLAAWERQVFYESTHRNGPDCGECLEPIGVPVGSSFSARPFSAPPSTASAPAAKCRK